MWFPFIAADVRIVGPITFRVIGYVVTGLLSQVTVATIVRDPKPRTVILCLSASVLVFFGTLQWVGVLVNLHGQFSGHSYALWDVGPIALPVVAWLSGRRRVKNTMD